MSKKRIVITVIIIAGLSIALPIAIASTYGKEGAPDANQSSEINLTRQNKITIDIKNFAYSKPNILIKRGTTVTWTNLDSVEHSVMNGYGDNGSTRIAPTVSEINARVFDGPLLSQGQSYSFTFNKVKTIQYHCAPHPGTKGTIKVIS